MRRFIALIGFVLLLSNGIRAETFNTEDMLQTLIQRGTSGIHWTITNYLDDVTIGLWALDKGQLIEITKKAVGFVAKQDESIGRNIAFPPQLDMSGTFKVVVCVSFKGSAGTTDVMRFFKLDRDIYEATKFQRSVLQDGNSGMCGSMPGSAKSYLK
jgi:hypothetical protein